MKHTISTPKSLPDHNTVFSEHYASIFAQEFLANNDKMVSPTVITNIHKKGSKVRQSTEDIQQKLHLNQKQKVYLKMQTLQTQNKQEGVSPTKIIDRIKNPKLRQSFSFGQNYFTDEMILPVKIQPESTDSSLQKFLDKLVQNIISTSKPEEVEAQIKQIQKDFKIDFEQVNTSNKNTLKKQASFERKNSGSSAGKEEKKNPFQKYGSLSHFSQLNNKQSNVVSPQQPNNQSFDIDQQHERNNSQNIKQQTQSQQLKSEKNQKEISSFQQQPQPKTQMQTSEIELLNKIHIPIIYDDCNCKLCEEKPIKIGKINCCNHVFCFNCIVNWNFYKNTCPICSEDFVEINKENGQQKPEEDKKCEKDSKDNDSQSSEEEIDSKKEEENKKPIETEFMCQECNLEHKISFKRIKYVLKKGQKVICSKCYQRTYRTCNECHTKSLEKLQKFNQQLYCNNCLIEKIKESTCSKCQNIYDDNKYSKKTLKTGAIICLSCFEEDFCQHCQLNIETQAYMNSKGGKVCLNCFHSNYCSCCKNYINNTEVKDVQKEEGQKEFYMKFNKNQQKNFLYCVKCYKENFCSICDEMLNLNSTKNVHLKSQNICEKCIATTICDH